MLSSKKCAYPHFFDDSHPTSGKYTGFARVVDLRISVEGALIKKCAYEHFCDDSHLLRGNTRASPVWLMYEYGGRCHHQKNALTRIFVMIHTYYGKYTGYDRVVDVRISVEGALIKNYFL